MLLSVEIRCPECDSPNVIRRHPARAYAQSHAAFPLSSLRTYLYPPRPSARLLQRGYSQTFKEQVLAAYQERASMRGISRVFGISRNTLTKWLGQKGGSSDALARL